MNVLAVREAVAEPNLDSLVHDLRQAYVKTGVELMVTVGKLIVEQLYGGDSTRWRSRGRKDLSFRRLEAHPQLPFHASTLSRAVSLYLFSRRRPDLLQLQHLGASHLQEMLGLAGDEQDRLLVEAETQGWSVQRLRAEVRALRTRASGHDRSRTPGFSRGLRRLRPHIESRSLLTDLDAIVRLEADEARDMLGVVQRLCQQAEQLARQLAGHLTALERGGLARPVPAADIAHCGTLT